MNGGGQTFMNGDNEGMLLNGSASCRIARDCQVLGQHVLCAPGAALFMNLYAFVVKENIYCYRTE